MRKLSFLIALTLAAVFLASACGDGGQPGAPATEKIAFIQAAMNHPPK